MTMLQVAIFLLVSARLVHVSRAALRRPCSHGFWRFWAWEAIAALVVLNAPVWFRDLLAGRPQPLRQLVHGGGNTNTLKIPLDMPDFQGIIGS